MQGEQIDYDSFFPSVFDNSMLSLYKHCPAKFWRTYIQEWKFRAPSIHLHAGGAFAHGLEAARTAFYEQGDDAETAISKGLSALITFYGDFECPPDSAKSLDRMAGALEFYFSKYPLESRDGEGTPIHLPGTSRRGIEFSFAEPLPVAHPVTGDPIIYCGRMDAILQLFGGSFICDEKTTQSLGSSWSDKWDLRAQFTGYAWGCRRAGIDVGGAVVRGISILKTKYDTAQALTYRPEWMQEQWLGETCSWIERIKSDWTRQYWLHNLDEGCQDFGGCAFRRVCANAKENQLSYLTLDFERRHWDPLTRQENLLP